ncbi:MAG: hypothetical protein IPG56_18985 [Caulobacteraceae bacterium]|nr:hypothetical protein [Caulobacteraceae bacterium]
MVAQSLRDRRRRRHWPRRRIRQHGRAHRRLPRLQERVAIITGADAHYARQAENAAQRLKAAGADWVLLAGKPGEREAELRAAGIDQFVFAGQNALTDLETLHTALGVRT